MKVNQRLRVAGLGSTTRKRVASIDKVVGHRGAAPVALQFCRRGKPQGPAAPPPSSAWWRPSGLLHEVHHSIPAQRFRVALNPTRGSLGGT
jgi:hypothetical protein